IVKAIPNVLIEVVNQIARIVHLENNVVVKLQNLTGLANQKVDNSIHKEHYDRMHEKLTQNKSYAKRMVRIRSKTVEPVIGTLVNFMNMKRVNTRGIKSSNKHVLMASLVYNLQKYLRFIVKKPSILAQAIALSEGEIYASLKSVSVFINNSILSVSNLRIFCKN
ncbi:transposase, partial [Flectobacillus sp. BAB-3569]|uniref:transposase n=1 Tax=Flectobacillus sp. BAB-3569 TaxID=1509483 RepID=UPI001C3E80A4